jgi:hypothetical protein
VDRTSANRTVRSYACAAPCVVRCLVELRAQLAGCSSNRQAVRAGAAVARIAASTQQRAKKRRPGEGIPGRGRSVLVTFRRRSESSPLARCCSGSRSSRLRRELGRYLSCGMSESEKRCSFQYGLIE